MAKQESNTVGSVLPFRRRSLSVIVKESDGRVSIVESGQVQEQASAAVAQERKMVSTRPWDLTKPQYDDENYYRYRAQSILTGIGFRDGSSIGPLLPVEQAVDVVNWNWDTGSRL